MDEAQSNLRAPDMWRIISAAVEFTDKNVLDIGCGYGDFLWRAWESGAKGVLGFDKSGGKVNLARDILKDLGYENAAIQINRFDLEKWDRTTWGFKDIIFCFSVLPYVKDISDTLTRIYAGADLSLIECPYYGDGYGPATITDDNDMRELLKSIGWNRVESIGSTLVEERARMRTIWLCE